MIKLIAALTMLIDHVGVLFFPEVYTFRVIGRLSMPLFAYCVARGFYYSSQHNTVRKYLRNMLILALVAQVPYSLFADNLNICFTWLVSLLLLTVSEAAFASPLRRIGAIIVSCGAMALLVESGLLPVDYGFSGVITPLLFYVLIKHKRENTTNYMLVLLVAWAYYVLVQRGSLAQIISVAGAPALTVSKRFDGKMKPPKWLFYSFYPLHLIILLVINYLIV